MQSNGRLPPLSALRAFETAADELSMTPAAISHQIYALEADLGVGLFKRLNRSVELTVSARVLLPGLSEAFPGIQSSGGQLRPRRPREALATSTPGPVAWPRQGSSTYIWQPPAGTSALGLVAPSAISPSKEIDERVHAFLDRPLAGEWSHLWLDAKSRRHRETRPRKSGSARPAARSYSCFWRLGTRHQRNNRRHR